MLLVVHLPPSNEIRIIQQSKKMWKTFCFHRRNRFWYAKHSGIRIELSWCMNVGKYFVFLLDHVKNSPLEWSYFFRFFVHIFWILFNFVCFRNCNMSTALTFRCLNVIYCLKKYEIWPNTYLALAWHNVQPLCCCLQ